MDGPAASGTQSAPNHPGRSPGDAIHFHRRTRRPGPATSSIHRSSPKPAGRVQADQLCSPGELRDWGLITVVLLTTGFALLGFCLEWLFRRLPRGSAPVCTITGWIPFLKRLRGATTRFAIGLGAGDRLRPGKYRSVPALRVASPAQKHRARLSGGLPLPAPVPGNRPLPSVPRGRAFPHHSGDDTQARFWYLRLASFVGWFAFGYITVEQFSLLGASREARQILAYILGLGLLGIGLESIWRNPRVSSDPSSRISTLAALRLLRRTLAPVGRGSHAALLACDGRGRPSHGDQADATLGQPHPPPTRRSRPDPDPSSTPATAPPSLLAVGLERGARATMIIAAAILLSYVWNIDLIELSGRNTLPTRLLRGALAPS